MSSYQYLTYRRNAKVAANKNASDILAKQKLSEEQRQELYEKARNDFGFFCEFVADKPPAEHHKEWHRHLITGENSSVLHGIAGPNVDLLGPRGSAKSTCLGLFTAWAIGNHTHAGKPLQILYLSYTLEIARSKSATIKRIIDSDRYRSVFPRVRLMKNVQSNEYWSIDHAFAGIDTTGEEQFTLCAAGLKGSVTSKRSHLCLLGDTLVTTNAGPVPISLVYEEPEKYLIGVRNATTDLIDWSRVAAVTRRHTKGLVRITTADGNSICSTPEHPFITADGRQEGAGDLDQGQALVCLSSWKQHRQLPLLRRKQETNTTHLRKLLQGDTLLSCQPKLSDLLDNIQSQFVAPFAALIKDSFRDLLQPEVWQSFLQDIITEALSLLLQDLSTGQLSNQMLLEGVCPQTTCTSHEGARELKLQARVRSQRLQETKAPGPGKGFVHVRRLWHEGAAQYIAQRDQEDQSLRASHRPHKDKQYPGQFNHVVQAMPCGTSPDNGSGWEAKSISRIEHLSEAEDWVYDLEVDHPDHNFIANGFNVLNCIIDDPVKSSADIANPDIRKMMQDNWNAVISPTMFEGGRAICLGTRFRHDDIHATTFNPQNNWQQIVLSAIQVNPITGDEESYWPEMWSLEYLKQKKMQAPIAFSFQYMNQIVRHNELSLAPELLLRAEITTEFDALGVGVDLSAGTREKNDYTVFVLGGRIGEKIHIIDYRRMRVMGNLEKLDALKELLSDWNIIGVDENKLYYPTYNTCDIWSEAVQYQASLEADFKRVCLNNDGLHNLIWHPVKGFRADKLARFRGIMGLFEDRKILFNRYRKFSAMFDELTNFGNSNHDDCVDALVWLVKGLARKTSLYVDY